MYHVDIAKGRHAEWTGLQCMQSHPMFCCSFYSFLDLRGVSIQSGSNSRSRQNPLSNTWPKKHIMFTKCDKIRWYQWVITCTVGSNLVQKLKNNVSVKMGFPSDTQRTGSPDHWFCYPRQSKNSTTALVISWTHKRRFCTSKCTPREMREKGSIWLF